MQTKHLYEFGPFRLDAVERTLLRGGETVPLTPKVFAVLVLLIERSGHLVEREALLSAVWADSCVEEANLTVSISALRKALGEQADGRQYIETVPKRGYRFIAEVQVVADEPEDFILRKQTGVLALVEQKEEKADYKSSAGPPKNSSKPPSSKRLKLQAAAVAVALIVLTGTVFYLWKTSKVKQARDVSKIKSIAVLPFKQLEAGESEEWLGFGLMDVLITRLGSLNQIGVRPTGAVFKYIGVEQDILAIGRELKVDAVIEGSIQRVNGHVRVTVRLVQVRDGELLWADTFDGRYAEIFALQDEMSERVAVTLALKSEGKSEHLLTKRYTETTEAYQAYTKGRYLWNKRTIDGWMKAIEYFKDVIEKDQAYALAYTGLADCYSLLVHYNYFEPKEGFPKAKGAAIEALKIDDTLAEAHTSLAKILHLYDWNWEEAEREFNRAIELNPNYSTARQWYGEYLISMGRFDEAKTELRRALELDPVSLAINVAQGFPYYYNREYDKAIAAYKKALELDPNLEYTRKRLYEAYVQKRAYDEAIAAYPYVPEDRENQERTRRIYAASGMRGLWEASVAVPEEEVKRGSMYIRAQAHAFLGENDKAFKWLEKIYDSRGYSLTLLKIDPCLDNLRSDPRFTNLLRRMRLEP